ncbi:multidrug effflux MFS transporter [Ferrovibrio xuzhouensis]|uniref:Bcr/CflA family efflux transporter n=1 Tax=Ferrovibrio xuzhouensis TaxID=1576914 RepID=A0ABV7VFA8_9PROT
MSTSASPRPAFLRNALILGLLTAIGPFAIDMYLPALPSIGASLAADPDAVLMSLTAFFITFAGGQLVYGPVSDMVGRKPPLYFGLVVFVLASLGCALAPNIHVLIGFRALQGVGGAAGMVIARAVVRDLHSGLDEARLLALLMLVFSVSPLLAPITGSLVIEAAGWRYIFWAVLVAALLGLVMVMLLVPETRPREQRADSSVAALFAACGRLLTDRHFLGLTFISAFGMAGFFIFLANSSFVMMGQYGLSSRLYSLVFSENAAAFFIAAQFSSRLGARYGLHRIVRPAVIAYAAIMGSLFALTAAGVHSLPVLLVLLFFGYGCLGIILPATSVLALTAYGAAAGTAASMMSTLQLGLGAVLIGVSGRFADGTATPMVAGIAVCGGIALLLALLTPIRAGDAMAPAGAAD